MKAEAELLVSFSGSRDRQSFLPNNTLHVLGQQAFWGLLHLLLLIKTEDLPTSKRRVQGPQCTAGQSPELDSTPGPCG